MTKTLDRNTFFTTEDIGEKRSMTPEGFLVCHDVPIARIGVQLYASDEVPVEDAGNGEVRIDRLPDEVFRPETIASFEGKPVTVEHPNEFVTPENWSKHAIGVTQNVRRGEGLLDDLLIADLVITDKAAIDYVNKELPQVSAGYEATYEQTEPGRGVQRDIVGNHVALVERGRAGPRCSIQDGDIPMKKKVKRSVWDRLMTAVKARDAEAIEKELEEAKDEEEISTEITSEDESTAEKVDNDLDREVLARIEKLEAKLDRLLSAMSEDEDELEKTEEMGDEDELEKNMEEDDDLEEENEETADTILNAETAESNPDAKGRVLSGDSLKKLVSRAEILAPGLSFPTRDKARSKAGAHSIMRSALTRAYSTDAGRACIDPFLSGRSIKSLTSDALTSVFIGAAELMRERNNARGVRHSVTTRDFGRASTAADINARNREFWAGRAR